MAIFNSKLLNYQRVFWVVLKEDLVGGAITILKNMSESQWVSDDIPYMKWKIRFMFQTTNQIVNDSLT